MAVRDSVKVDPALERWNAMREAVYTKFRWTPRTTRVGLWGLVLVPGAVYYLASQSDAKYNWNGKRKGESLLARPPPAASEEE